MLYQFPPLEDESKFEYLIKDLLNIEFSEYSNFDLYGKKGQKQFGNDIIGYNKQGQMILAQAKKKDISRKNLKGELLKDFENEIGNILQYFKKDNIDKIIFATTYKRDTILQEKARSLSAHYKIDIVYWGWDTIAEKINQSIDIQTKYYTTKSKNLTTLPHNPYCCGREKEFLQIENLLSTVNIVNIQSIGGLGKSTLASQFLHLKKSSFDYIGFIPVEENLEEALFRSLGNFFELQKEKKENIIDSLLYKLDSLKGKKLLVIDNLLYQKDIEYIQKLNSDFTVLITSRILFNDIAYIKLPLLAKSSLRELFFKYNNDTNVTDEEINELFVYLDYHTLFIELTAKAINNNDFTIQYILEEFKNGNLSQLSVEIDLDTLEEKTYDDYLKKLFEQSMMSLPDEYIFKLALLSLFPSINLQIHEINSVFEKDFTRDLILLSKKGWIIQLDKSIFKMHQIIKEFIIYNYPLECRHVSFLIIYYLRKIEWNELEHPERQSKYMIFAKSLIDSLYDYDESLITLSNNLAMLYRYYGNYNLALRYMLFVKEYDEQYNNPKNLAQTYNNIAQVYDKMNENELSEKYTLLSLKLREEIPSHNIQENYLSLVASNLSKKNYPDAKIYLDKLLAMQIKKDVIPVYNAAMMYYLHVKNFDKAIEYASQALCAIDSQEVDDRHLYIMYTYSNIGDIYIAKENWEEAIFYKEKAKKLGLTYFDASHPDLEPLQQDLNVLYVIMSKYTMNTQTTKAEDKKAIR